MKITTKLILIIGLICISAFSSRSIHHSKAHSWTKRSVVRAKEGSWEKGYINKIRVWEGTKEKGVETEADGVQIIGKQIEDPQNDVESSGLILKFTSSKLPGGSMLHILEKHPTKWASDHLYILPYKNIYKDFQTKRVGIKKFLFIGNGRHTVLIGHVTHKDDPTKKYRLKISLPYHTDTMDIPSEEINKLVYYLNMRRTSTIEEIRIQKSNAIRSANRLAKEIETETSFALFKDNLAGLQKQTEEKLQEILKKAIGHELLVIKYQEESLKMRKENDDLTSEIFHLKNRLTSETKEAEVVHDELESLTTDIHIINAKKFEFSQKGFLAKDRLKASLNNLLALDPRKSTFVSDEMNLINKNKFDKENFFKNLKSLDL